jgi:hypothetical protein
MSEPENFIARWARRKAAAQDAEARPAAAPAAAATPADGGDGDRKENDAAPTLGGTLEPSPAAFDPAKLPPIESITAQTDIRAFLAPGVPAHLTRAALRRAWASDPKIRDFVGLSENSWDWPTLPLRPYRQTSAVAPRLGRTRAPERPMGLLAPSPCRTATRPMLRRSPVQQRSMTIN